MSENNNLALAVNPNLVSESPRMLLIPNEVLRRIFDFTQPDDIESLASVCRRHYNISEDILAEHRQLKREYTDINDNDPLTIVNLLQYPDACLYVKRVVIYQNRSSYRKWQDDAEEIDNNDQYVIPDEDLTYHD